MTINQYIENINSRYKSGLSTEHTFRGDLQSLLETLIPGIKATNEPKRQACGAPDYILTVKEIPVGYIEAKDLGDADLAGLKKTGNKAQFDRYKNSLENIIFTDYLDFHFYRYNEKLTSIKIGDFTGKGIVPLKENFETFEKWMRDFCSHSGQTIRSSKRLAEMMAGKARLMADVIEKSLNSDDESEANSSLRDQMMAFRQILIHDISPKTFADVYAQTVAYGLFAARLHDATPETFSRQEAAELIPRTNPFLRRLFQHIAGPEIDDRIQWIVDDLALIFRACDVEAILKNYGKATKTEDPIIHFYETFLSEYDPALRKSRGVWYTPQPVVNFIVRAVDDILKTEFNLPQGLADTSKTKIKIKDVRKATADRRSKVKEIERKEEVHRVQILDPATGTGTFLAEAVKHIHKSFEGQQGIWNQYVEKHLLPRLNGFELLMASYAMAHLKLDLVLKETGYNTDTNQRLRIYLTNSLEEYHPDTGTLWANWLSNEANEANRVKRDTPVMVVMGNPPYSGESVNKGEWITNLIDVYKTEPEGKLKLQEKNPKWLNDDYVKFLRYGQFFIEKNGKGVLAFINPHGFLDNPTFRGMRWNLLKTYDKIYTIDLHGNAKKKEVSPDGSPDENVFDIMQGVSINIFVKTGKKKENELGKVFHYDLYGKREFKYSFLIKNSIETVLYKELKNVAPNYYMVHKDYDVEKKFNEGFSIKELFNKISIGVQSHRDNLVIDFEKVKLIERFKEIFRSDDLKTLALKLKVNESSTWNLGIARNNEKEIDLSKIQKITYRALDERFIYYSDNFVDRTRKALGRELIKDNIVFNFPKIVKVDWNHSLITKYIPTAISMDINGTYFAPLYIYPKDAKQQSTDNLERTPNFNMKIVEKIATQINHAFLPDENLVCDLAPGIDGSFSPLDLLDYIYAVLHSPTYREKYKEFLKIDFPRVPYPKNADTFWQLAELGTKLRETHLMENVSRRDAINRVSTQYNIPGNNIVDKVRFELYEYNPEIPDENGNINYPDYLGAVFINDTQYFADVPMSAWEFYIGGYQPAQKWLKDRKGRTLSYDDILHYQNIIDALLETSQLMKGIDKIEIE